MGQIDKWMAKYGTLASQNYTPQKPSFSARRKSGGMGAIPPWQATKIPPPLAFDPWDKGWSSQFKFEKWASQQWGYQADYDARPAGQSALMGGNLRGAQRIQAVINPIKSKLSWGFEHPGDVMGRLKRMGPAGISNAPGYQALQKVVTGLQGKGYNPRLWMGSASTFPYIQMELGNEIIDMPFEMHGGGVVQGMKHKAVRSSIKEDQLKTFSDRLVAEFDKMPARQSPSFAGQEGKKAINRLHAELSSSAMHGGRQLASRVHFYKNQVKFGESHLFSRELQSIVSTVGRINKGEFSGGRIEEEFRGVQDRLIKLYKDVGDAGYTVLGTKWEQMQGLEGSAARMIATHSNFTIYQGLMAGDPAKGFGHLSQRELINTTRMRGLGYNRVMPWVQPRGYGAKQTYEVGMNVGILHSKIGTRLLGDSGAALTSERAVKTFAEFPATATRTIHARIEGVEKQTVERAFSNVFEGMFQEGGLDKRFEKEQVFKFKTPVRFKEFEDFKNVIGQSLGRGADPFDVGVGEFETVPKNMMLESIKARRRGRHMEYDFLFAASKGELDVARATGLLGTHRFSVKGMYNIGGDAGVDLLVRGQDFWKKSFGTQFSEVERAGEVVQSSIANRWLELSKRSGGIGAQGKVADILGLGASVRRGATGASEQVYTAGNEWLLTKERVSNLLSYFRQTKDLRHLGTKDTFFSTGVKLGASEFRSTMQQMGVTDPIEIAEYRRLNDTKSLLRMMESAGVSVRSGMAGLKQAEGMRYRMNIMTGLMAHAGSDPVLAQAYMGEAEAVGKLLRKSSASAFGEAVHMWGPALDAGNVGVQGVKTYTVEQYLERFKLGVPKLQEGVSTKSLVGTVLEKGRSAFFLDLGEMAPYYYGTEREMAAGGGELWTRYNKFLVTSSDLAGIAADKKGMHYLGQRAGLPLTPALATAELDELIRTGGPARTGKTLGLAMSALHSATRATLFGKAGKATPNVLAEMASYSRLQLLSGRAEDAYSMGITEEGLKARFEDKMKPHKFRDMMGQIKAGKFHISGLRWPIKESSNYVPAIKLRLVDAIELSTLQTGVKGNWDDVLFAGRGLVHLWRGDHDADTIVAHFNMNSDAQKRMTKIAARETGWLKFLGDQAADLETRGVGFAKFMTEDEAKVVRAGFSKNVAEGTAALHKVKHGSPFPEVYMRARKEIAKLMAINSGAVKSFTGPGGAAVKAADILKGAGLEKLIGVNVSGQQLRATESLIGTWSQEFTGKAEGATFGLIKALGASRQGQDIGPIKAALRDLISSAETSGKFVQVAKGYGSAGAMVDDAAQVLGAMERVVGGKRGVSTPFGAFYGMAGDKSVSAVAQALGVGEQQMEAYADLSMTQELAKTRGVKVHAASLIEDFNANVKADVAGQSSHIQQRLSPRSIVNGLKGLWASGWKGKMAISLGGALAVKGLADTLTPSDSFASSQAPLPPDLRMPMQPTPPQFAIPMADTRVENVREQAFKVEGAIRSPYFETEGLFDHLSTNILDSRLAFGQVSVQNRPMTETEMEYLLRDKMRSDF